MTHYRMIARQRATERVHGAARKGFTFSEGFAG